jgi:C4-dicarboxylate-specific signal transduction histidine kinase
MTTAVAGDGLGLYLVHPLVTTYGGRSASRTANHGGTAVTVGLRQA